MRHDSYTSKGIRYDGQFVNGSYHGQGKFAFGNGDVYDGVYDSGVRHGTGTYVSRHAHSRSPVRVTRELRPIRGWGAAHTSVLAALCAALPRRLRAGTYLRRVTRDMTESGTEERCAARFPLGSDRTCNRA